MSRILIALSPFVGAALVLLTIAAIVWGTRRGFDATDEGYYLLEYRSPGPSATSFGSIVHLFVGSHGPDIVALRVARLCMTVGSALVFGYAVSAWMRRSITFRFRPWDSAVVSVAAMSGALIGYSHVPQTLSYNSIVDFLLLIFGAALMGALSQRSSGRRVRTLLAAVGVSTALAFFVKPPSGVALLGVANAAVVYFYTAPSIGRVGAALGSLWLGIALGTSAFFLIFQSPADWMDSVSTAWISLQSTNHGLRALIVSGARDAVHTAAAVALGFWPPISLALLLALLRRRNVSEAGRAYRWCSASVVALVMGCTLHLYLFHRDARLQFVAAQPIMAALICVAISVVCSKPSHADTATPIEAPRVLRTGVILLTVLPLAGSAGSNNPPSFQVLGHMAPWLALLLVLSLRNSARRGLAAITVVCTCIVGATFTIRGFVFEPFRLRDDLLAQSDPVDELPALRGLLVDRETGNFLVQVRRVLGDSGFADGDPIVALHDMAGVVYAVGGRSPGSNWYGGGSTAANTSFLARATDAEKTSAFLLLDGRRPDDAPRELRDAGFDFPDGYELAARLDNPYQRQEVRIYRPRLRRHR